MNTETEILDIVDIDDNVIGQAPRHRVHAESLRHRAVHVFVFNTQGELFIQLRSKRKDTYPGYYDSSASGHLESGEQYDSCATRELLEELRLNVYIRHLQKHFLVTACEPLGWEFIWLYSIKGDFCPEPNPAEIESGKFWSRSEIETSLEKSANLWAPCFRFIFREFCQRNLWPK